MEHNDKIIRNGIIGQHVEIIDSLTTEIIKALHERDSTSLLWAKKDKGWEAKLILIGFIKLQLGLIRTKIITDPNQLQTNIKEEIINICKENFPFYKSLILQDDQDKTEELKKHAKEAVNYNFNKLLEYNYRYNIEEELASFVDELIKWYRIKLIAGKFDILDISASGFVEFAKVNLISHKVISEKIYKEVTLKVESKLNNESNRKAIPNLKEVMDDIIMKIIEGFNNKISKGNLVIPPYIYLSGICRNKINDFLATLYNKDDDNGDKYIYIDENGIEYKILVNKDDDKKKKSKQLIKRSEIFRCRDILRKLERECQNKNYKTIIRLHYDNDYSYEKISELSSTSKVFTERYTPGTVKQNAQKVRDKIRKAVKIY